MLSLGLRAKQIEKLAIDNSPVLLTAIGVVGTITTAFLTHTATIKAESILTQAEKAAYKARTNEYDVLIDRKNELKLVWKIYIPPAVSGGLTICAIVFANRIGTKRAAAVAAAYGITEKAYSEYRDKVIEKFGDSKEQNLRDDLVRERIAANPQTESNVVVIGSGDVECFEMYTGRYFDSSVEEIKKCMNDTNYQINAHGYSSLSDFYDRLGLPRTTVSEEVGWTSDKLMEIEFTTVLSENGRPCVAINFGVKPIRDYHRFR